MERHYENANFGGHNNGLEADNGDSCPTSSRDSSGPCKSKSEYVLDVLKSREKWKISLSWSCLPDPLAAKFQYPGDLFVNFAASFAQSLHQAENPGMSLACPEAHSVQGSTLDPPAGISENQT